MKAIRVGFLVSILVILGSSAWASDGLSSDLAESRLAHHIEKFGSAEEPCCLTDKQFLERIRLMMDVAEADGDTKLRSAIIKIIRSRAVGKRLDCIADGGR